MLDKLRPLGRVKLVQLQPNGLIIDSAGKTPSGYFYDPSRLAQTDQIEITPQGIEATISEEKHVLDIHHMEHPDKEYDDDDLICIGFTSHYNAMRMKFGNHMEDGIGGENIIIEFSDEVWPNTLNQKLGIESQDNGKIAILELVSFAAPCVEFSQFCAQQQYEKLAPDKMKAILKFLGNGRRGFLFVLNKKQDVITIRPGDKAYILSN